jgi:hypothetical protein
MSDQLFVNADWSALVPAGSSEAAFGIQPEDAKRRGLLALEEGETLEEPKELKNQPDPEPEAKEAEKPEDKAAAKPANKGRRK